MVAIWAATKPILIEFFARLASPRRWTDGFKHGHWNETGLRFSAADGSQVKYLTLFVSPPQVVGLRNIYCLSRQSPPFHPVLWGHSVDNAIDLLEVAVVGGLGTDHEEEKERDTLET